MKQYNHSIRSKLFNYFKQRFNIKNSTKGWYRFNCIYCARRYAMGINLRENHIKCFGCDVHTTPIKVLMEVEGFDTFNQAYTFIKGHEEFEAYTETNLIKTKRKKINLPQSYELLSSEPQSLLGKMAYNYLIVKRKFTPQQLLFRSVGFCSSGPYAGYVIFPFFKMGVLYFFQGRKYNELGLTKMKNPGNEDFGVGKTQVIYNIDALFIYRKVHIVESITNSITLGDNSIAILGKIPSTEQLQIIMASPVEMINIVLDDDAMEQAIHFALLLCQFKKVKITKMPFELDVNDIGREETIKLSKDEKYGDYKYFFQMKLDYDTYTNSACN